MGDFEKHWEQLCMDCDESDVVQRIIWLRREGRIRRMHGGLLDSAILDAVEQDDKEGK